MEIGITRTMFMKIFISCLLILATSGFQYGDLKDLRNCNPFDSCKTNSSSSIRNCYCDHQCKSYGDCCLDSEYYSVDESKKNYLKTSECINVNYISKVYMKVNCDINWNDVDISEKCEKDIMKSIAVTEDLIGSVPVTSLDTNTTYPNYYCAICNLDSSNLSVWSVGWDCKSHGIPNESSNLAYVNGTWGVKMNKTDSLEFKKCDVYPAKPPRLGNSVRECIQDVISNCPSNYEDENVENLCHSYTATVNNKNVQNYRNVHCAMCNSVNPNETNCLQAKLPRFDNNIPSFAFLFDFTDSSGSNVVGSVCKKTEIWDPFFKKCRDVVCGKPGQVFSVDRCIDDSDFNPEPSDRSVTGIPIIFPTSNPDSTTIPIIFPTSKTNSSTTKYPNESQYTTTQESILMSTITATGTVISPNSTDFETCPKILLKYDEFTFYENGSLYVKNYEKVYTPDEFQLVANGIHVCSSLTDSSKFSPAMTWVAIVCMLASCLCLMIHLIAFFLVPDLRNLSGKNLSSLCLTLLAAYVTFIVSVFLDSSTVDCMALAIMIYYFLLSAFCWMNVTAFDIWLTFRLTKTELRVISGNQWHKFIGYSLYSWLMPVIAVVTVLAIDIWQPEGIPDDFLPSLGTPWCWFGQRKALLVFFALPTSIMIVVNCVFFISTARIITETTVATAHSTTTSSHHKNQFKMHLRLAVLMGFTWLFGTVAGYLQIEALWYIFVLLNTLQGVFIFLAFTCRRKVWRVMGVTSHKIAQRSTSWLSRHVGGRNSQNMELKNASTPSTSLDAL